MLVARACALGVRLRVPARVFMDGKFQTERLMASMDEQVQVPSVKEFARYAPQNFKCTEKMGASFYTTSYVEACKGGVLVVVSTPLVVVLS